MSDTGEIFIAAKIREPIVVVKPGKLTVTETSVHKVNGKPLYNWKQENGVWKKVTVS